MELRDGRHDDSVEEALCRIIQEAGFGQQEELKNVIMCSECWRESEGLHVCAPPVSTWPRRLDLFAVLSAWIRPTYRAIRLRWDCCVSDATTAITSDFISISRMVGLDNFVPRARA
jgi:hypothetical protein